MFANGKSLKEIEKYYKKDNKFLNNKINNEFNLTISEVENQNQKI